MHVDRCSWRFGTPIAGTAPVALPADTRQRRAVGEGRGASRPRAPRGLHRRDGRRSDRVESKRAVPHVLEPRRVPPPPAPGQRRPPPDAPRRRRRARVAGGARAGRSEGARDRAREGGPRQASDRGQDGQRIPAPSRGPPRRPRIARARAGAARPLARSARGCRDRRQVRGLCKAPGGEHRTPAPPGGDGAPGRPRLRRAVRPRNRSTPEARAPAPTHARRGRPHRGGRPPDVALLAVHVARHLRRARPDL